MAEAGSGEVMAVAEQSTSTALVTESDDSGMPESSRQTPEGSNGTPMPAAVAEGPNEEAAFWESLMDTAGVKQPEARRGQQQSFEKGLQRLKMHPQRPNSNSKSGSVQTRGSKQKGATFSWQPIQQPAAGELTFIQISSSST